MKCPCCGEEVGAATVCPICGSSVAPRATGGGISSAGPTWRRVSGAPTRSATPAQSGAATGAATGATSGANAGGGILQQIAEEKKQLVEECSKAVCKVLVKRKGPYNSAGTGWCGYGNYIITNAHVVSDMVGGDGKEITCEFSDKLDLKKDQTIHVDLIYYSEVEDIAILLPKSGALPVGVKVLHIEGAPTKQGELVFTIGNPLHYKFTYMEGAVANPNYTPRGSKRKFTILQTTLTLNHGNSGGPVMNANGDIVGMATFSELNPETQKTFNPIGLITGKEKDLITEETTYKEILGYGFCVKSEAILAAIQDTENKRRR